MVRDDQSTYETVRELLEEWDPTFRSYTVAEERMQLYLDRALNPDPIDRRDPSAIRAPKRPTTADVVVNDTVGVNIYRTFTKREFGAFRTLTDKCEQDFLVMYAYDLPIEDGSRDQWRWTKSRYSGTVGDVDDVTFVHHIPGQGDDRSMLDEILEYPEAVLFGALSFVVGVALFSGSLGGDGQSIVGGPLVTGVTSLVLVVFLVLLWGWQNEDL